MAHMAMRDFLVYLAALLGILASLVALVDSIPRARTWLRRRRLNRGGAFGAVVDSSGRVLGIYLDPWGHPWRSARVHEGTSAWTSDAGGWACEGFGATAEEAIEAANRHRRRHRLLIGLRPDDADDGGPPWALPGG
jgi:hypothetical protein